MKEYSEEWFQEDIANSIDIGCGHYIEYFQFAPNRELNPQYDGIPDIPKSGLTLYHRKPNGQPCSGGVYFDLPEVRAMQEASRLACIQKGIAYSGRDPVWKVLCWEPLTLAPSLHCKAIGCNDHGFIRNGLWVVA